MSLEVSAGFLECHL